MGRGRCVKGRQIPPGDAECGDTCAVSCAGRHRSGRGAARQVRYVRSTQTPSAPAVGRAVAPRGRCRLVMSPAAVGISLSSAPGEPLVSPACHCPGVTAKERPADRGARLCREATIRLGRELREARRAHDLSLGDVGRAVGLAPSSASRIERGLWPAVPALHLFRMAVVVGLDPTMRMYPGGDPIRDAAHVRLLARFSSRLEASLRWASEVPLPLPGDRRSLGWPGRRQRMAVQRGGRDGPAGCAGVASPCRAQGTRRVGRRRAPRPA
jgi:transcriptional regulator with XRE-family HTH domain